MKLCFLFGHANAPNSIMPRLNKAIEDCYSKGISHFYVGNRGQFDGLAAAAVKKAKKKHRDIQLFLLLAYHPGDQPVNLTDGFDGSYYPPLESVPRKYSIVRGNRYMVDASDYLICYVKHSGNTRNLLEYAQRRKQEGVPIENLAVDDL